MLYLICSVLIGAVERNKEATTVARGLLANVYANVNKWWVVYR